MFEPGTLIYFTPFYFKNNAVPLNKFFVILHWDSNNGIIANLPTSQDHIPQFCTQESGCIELPGANFNCYCIQSKEVITDNGFSFDLKTILYGTSIDNYDKDHFNQYPFEEVDYSVKGKIKDELFKDILNCFINSKCVKKKYIPKIKETLNNIK